MVFIPRRLACMPQLLAVVPRLLAVVEPRWKQCVVEELPVGGLTMMRVEFRRMLTAGLVLGLSVALAAGRAVAGGEPQRRGLREGGEPLLPAGFR